MEIRNTINWYFCKSHSLIVVPENMFKKFVNLTRAAITKIVYRERRRNLQGIYPGKTIDKFFVGFFRYCKNLCGSKDIPSLHSN